MESSKTRVVLADPPRLEKDYDAAYPNLGILYLIGNGRKNTKAAADIDFYYLESDYDINGHLEALEKLRPDVYGISYASFAAQVAHKTVRAVRQRFPKLPILAGGAHPTAAWEEVLSGSDVDVCVIGEGEVTFCEVIDHYSGTGKPLEDISGIGFMRNGKPERTEKRELVKNLDEIEHPAWDIVDFEKYKGLHLRKANPQTYTVLNRGCPFDCWFCSNPIWKENKPWVRMRSADSIAEEVELLYERGIREIYLNSDEFNVNLKWPLEVAKAIQDLGHRDLFFQCNVRGDKVTPELCRELVKMNLWMVHIGIESGNQRTLDGIQKKIRLEDVQKACRMFQEAGIKVFGFMMLYHAWEEDGKLAFETPGDVDNSLRFAGGLLKERLIDYMSWQVATPYPGARLWDTAVKYGLLEDTSFIGDVREPAMTLPGISKRDIEWSLKKGYVLKNFYALKNGNIGWKHVTRIRQNLGVILGMKWLKR